MSAASRKRAITRLRLAVCIQMTVPGVPIIYYGDEAGMEGHKDPFCRLPYP
jgi:4-alpha-glucanotransferase